MCMRRTCSLSLVPRACCCVEILLYWSEIGKGKFSPILSLPSPSRFIPHKSMIKILLENFKSTASIKLHITYEFDPISQWISHKFIVLYNHRCVQQRGHFSTKITPFPFWLIYFSTKLKSLIFTLFYTYKKY